MLGVGWGVSVGCWLRSECWVLVGECQVLVGC